MDSDQVDKLIADAWHAVESAGVAEAAQEVAFRSALELLTTGRIAPPKPRQNPGGGQGDDDLGRLSDVLDDTGDLAKIAKKLEVSVDLVGRVYRHNEDGDLTVDIAMSKLPKQTTAGARDIVCLVAAARQIVLDENDTETQHLVPILEEHRVYDSKNFKTQHVKNEKDRWKVTKGGDAVRISGDGMQTAAALVKHYAAAGD